MNDYHLSLIINRSIYLGRSETVLHDDFGGKGYWSVRRSMRFADYLRVEAQRFRREVLNSDDIRDQTQVQDDWRDTKVSHMMYNLTHI